MNYSDTSWDRKKLVRKLKKIIKKMRVIQKSIAADDQPVSMHELDALTRLGEDYAKIAAQIQTLETDRKGQ